MKAVFMLFASLLLASASYNALADIRIALASNFKPAMEDLVSGYSSWRTQQGLTPQTIQLITGSTGSLFAQINHGAPYDLFFAANAEAPDNLALSPAFNDRHPAFTYAIGRLAFWCPEGAPQTFDQLSQWRGSYAQANEKLAPYGLAATEVIARIGWDNTNRKITGNNVAQVSHFIASGNLACGFTALSLLPEFTPDSEIFMIPPELHSPIAQKALALTSKGDEFLQYMREYGGDIIVRHGYSLPMTD